MLNLAVMVGIMSTFPKQPRLAGLITYDSDATATTCTYLYCVVCKAIQLATSYLASKYSQRRLTQIACFDNIYVSLTGQLSQETQIFFSSCAYVLCMFV